MPASRTVFQVPGASIAGKWLVTMEQNPNFRLDFGTKAQAVEAALELAQEQEPSQVNVYSENGVLEHQVTYGLVPNRAANG